AAEGPQRVPRPDVPDDGGVVVTGGGQSLPVPAERQVVDPTVVPAQGPDEPARLAVPEFHRGIPITPGGGDARAVGAERYLVDGGGVPAEDQEWLLHDRDPAAGGNRFVALTKDRIAVAIADGDPPGPGGTRDCNDEHRHRDQHKG